jgi:CHAT domain-containing protein/Tfp pilus assembly protein PilF
VTRFISRFFIITGSLVFCLYYSLSQINNSTDYDLIFSQYQSGQKIYDEATAIGKAKNYNEEKEIELNKKALEIFRSVFQKMPATLVYDSLRFFSAFRIGELEHYFEHFSEALNGYENSINIKLKSKLPDSLLFKPYLYSGIIYYNQNQYDTAAIYFHNAEKIQLEYNYNLQENERLYNTFGVLYYEKGDYKQAKNYFLKALETLPQTHPYYKELFINYNINLAQIYFKLEDYDESNKIYQHLLALNPTNKNEIYHNIGLINLYLGASKKAISYFRKVNYDSTNKLISLYQNTGEAFFSLGQMDSAKKYFQKAIATNDRLRNNTDHLAYGLTLKSLGEFELKLGNFSSALNNYQKAIHQFYPGYSDTSVASNPSQFSGVFSYINLFNTLVAKAEAFHLLYRQSSQLSWAQKELNTYQSAFKLIDYVEKTYNSDEARLFLNKIKYVAHIKPIDIAYDLYQKTKEIRFLEDLYIFDQRNKASILALKTQSPKELLQKDSSLISRERNLRSEITRLSLNASQVYDSAEIEKLNKRIRDNEIELGKIQDRQPGSPVVTNIPSVHSLQTELLDKTTALLSFHLSADKLTTVLVSNTKFTCSQKILFEGFHEYISNYITELKNNHTDTISNQSKKIYSFLFDSIDLKNIERLIIIPDDELNYLSFESLQDKNGQYLVQKFSVQYQYSTSLLKKESVNFSNHQTLAFAPFVKKSFEDSSMHFEALPNSLNEINNLKGEKFIDSSATKTNFLNNLSKYKVLHLATHAAVNTKEDNLSFVAFYPSQNDKQDFLLYSEEIYNLPLDKTELIILSACETASGNLVKGEGVMSLSRAFAYAGCANIITSLWNANDFSTAYLTNRVHFYLDKDYSVDDALRQSKLDYLNDKSINPRLKNPFYWSHLIFIGNYSPAKAANYWWIAYTTAGLILLIFLFLKTVKPRIKQGLGGS